MLFCSRLDNNATHLFHWINRFAVMIPSLVLQAVCGLVLLTLANHAMSESLSRVERSSNCHVESNGCSIPGDLPFFYKDLFTPVCNKHDVCYFCGQLHGWSRSACDKAFKADMYARCKVYASGRKRFLGQAWKWISNLFKSKLSRCQSVADVYYISVDKFGKSFYEKKSPSWCQNNCTIPLGRP